MEEIRLTTFNDALRANCHAALNQDISKAISTISQDFFLAGLEKSNGWPLGPFLRREDLTFQKSKQLADPTGIGWTSSSIFNPSIIEESGELYLFFRAAVKKESLGSRIGLAIRGSEGKWRTVEKPVIYPTEENEILSTEDPKIYRIEPGKYIMFYNGVWRASAEEVSQYEKPYGDIACDIKYAVSEDLIRWEKRGLVVPYEISRLWAKGAVIPRDEFGNAVKINDEYWMFLSEGCGDKQYIGKSADLHQWRWEQVDYLKLPQEMGRHIFEVACAIVDGERLILDFMYEGHDGVHRGAQAIYELRSPTKALDFIHGATLSWGGIIKYDGRWCFAQGWDAPSGKEEIYFYSM
ncbi:MAG: hypothetical protein RLZZ317_610 [Actinomycetota bacterium]|jgi:predicted GH43/DUF377 family glycosyl hydrolase